MKLRKKLRVKCNPLVVAEAVSLAVLLGEMASEHTFVVICPVAVNIIIGENLLTIVICEIRL